MKKRNALNKKVHQEKEIKGEGLRACHDIELSIKRSDAVRTPCRKGLKRDKIDVCNGR
jgi:hypothetical protein